MYCQSSRLLVEYIVAAEEVMRLEQPKALSCLIEISFNLILIVRDSLKAESL